MKGIAIAISLFAVIASANAQSLRSQIEAADKTIHKCFIAKDVKGFATFLKGEVTSNFQYVEAGKAMNFDQMVKGMDQGLAGFSKITKADSKIVTLVEKGNTASATIHHTMEGTMVGQDKKTHKMTFTGLSTDNYVKQAGKWKMSKMTWGKQTMLLDGKPMNMDMPGSGKGK